MCLPAGKPSKDPSHPDYVPSVFSHVDTSQQKASAALNRYKRHLDIDQQRHSAKRAKVSTGDDTGLCQQTTAAIDVDASAMQDPAHVASCEETTASQGAQAGCKTEVEMLQTELEFVRQERDDAYRRISHLEYTLSKTKLSAACVEQDDKKCKFYTGLLFAVFLHVFAFLVKDFQQKQLKDSMAHKDQFFLTLVRLRLNLPFKFIADQAGSSSETIRRYCWKWLDAMHSKLNFLVSWPTHNAVRTTLPKLFRHKFPRLTSIVDCFEIFIDQSKNLEARAQTWSNYKHHNTVKVFIACTPTGAISFLSAAWGGRVSDVELVRQSGFISSKLHRPHDQILADRGFTLQDDFAVQCSAELIIPTFTRGRQQLEAKDVEKSRNMSRVRVHIERIIGALKGRFRILQGVMTIRSLKSLSDTSDKATLANVDKILRCCAILLNLGPSIVVADKEGAKLSD